MSSWYTNYTEFTTGAVHGAEIAANVPTGVLCWIDLAYVLDYDLQAISGTPGYPRRWYTGFALSWVAHGAGRPTFNTGGDDDSWFFWGGLDSGPALSGGGLSSGIWYYDDRQVIRYKWRGARQITGAHDWWAQANLNETGSPDTSNQSTVFARLGYW